MAAPFDLEETAVVHHRQSGFHFTGSGGLGKNKVQLCQQLQIAVQLIGKIRHQSRQHTEHLLHLCFFLQLQLPQAVIHLHHGFRLDKQGRSRSGLVMDQAAEMAAVFLLHRNDITVIADGHQGILQHFGDGRGAHHLLQLLPDFALSRTQLGSHLPQLGAGLIQHMGIVVNAASDLVLQRFIVLEQFRQLCQQGHGAFIVNVQQKPAQPPSAEQRTADVVQLYRIQHAADSRPVQRLPHIADAAEGGAALQPVHLEGFIRRLKPAFAFLQLRGRAQFFRQFLAQTGGGMADQNLDHFCIFQSLQYFQVHRCTLFLKPIAFIIPPIISKALPVRYRRELF
ncbi:hypothetical protein D3C75_641170 [compost metagenome]